MCVGSDSVEGHEANHEHKTYTGAQRKHGPVSQRKAVAGVTFGQTTIQKLQIIKLNLTSLTLLIVTFT